MQSPLEDEIEDSINSLLLNQYENIPRQFINKKNICGDLVDSEGSEILRSIPMIDFKLVRLIRVPTQFSSGNEEFDEECIKKFKEIDGLSDGYIQRLKQETPLTRAYRKKLYDSAITAMGLKSPDDDEKLAALKTQFGIEYFPQTFIPLDAVPPKKELYDSTKKHIVYCLATHMPPVSIGILLTKNYIETCILILMDNVLVKELAHIYYDYKIIHEEFKIIFFISVQT